MVSRLNHKNLALFPRQFGAIALGVMAIVLPACSSNEEVEDLGGTNVTTEEVAENPEALDNQLVTIRSNVKKTVGDSAFLVEDEALLGGESILVINTTGQPFTLPQDDDTEVQITGEVSPFVVADVNREFNLALDPEIFVEYETKPALLAESLALSPDPGEVTENPGNFYNKQIAIEGDIDEVLSANTFTMNDADLFGGEDLMVINLSPDTIPADGGTVTVTGVLRPFVKADFDKEYDLQWDLSVEEKLEAEYTNKPVFVADKVYPGAQ
ncbi:MAG TPA: hypothetical protein IGS17_03975 [Oscillatoriales cyanobacterium M59_W2019_021]|nr:MAG: hypothetical protein D6728_14235 [Cyanobacteria bacterium J055]HIK33630.1 hypothetical protein [Oscillatoriales cyanobacterium M4454_W2019_049]HIK50074.1 hypothetical protein [Oscillatoriales cyanobacterium M59_W2019_021]